MLVFQEPDIAWKSGQLWVNWAGEIGIDRRARGRDGSRDRDQPIRRSVIEQRHPLRGFSERCPFDAERNRTHSGQRGHGFHDSGFRRVFFATLIANRSRKINLGDAARELEGANLDPVRHGIRQPARYAGTGQQSLQ